MVDALKKVHRLLAPDGRLIDIHPGEEPRRIEVRQGSESTLAGWLREASDYIEYVQADEALAAAVDQGYFAQEQADTFNFLYHADTIHELRHHLEKTSSNAIVDDIVVMRADDLMRAIEPDQEILMNIPVQITRYRPLPLSGFDPS